MLPPLWLLPGVESSKEINGLIQRELGELSVRLPVMILLAENPLHALYAALGTQYGPLRTSVAGHLWDDQNTQAPTNT